MSNFEFLRRYWPQLADLASLAENYLYTDPNSTMIKFGMFAEQIVAEIFAVENLKTPETDDSQAARIRTLKREGQLPSAIDDILYVIRKRETMRRINTWIQGRMPQPCLKWPIALPAGLWKCTETGAIFRNHVGDKI